MGVFDTAAKKIINFLGMTTLGQKTKATALGVTLASDEDSIAIIDDGGSITIDSPGIPTSIGQKAKAAALGVTLASDEDLLALLDQLPASLGQKAMAASLAVVIASDQFPLKIDTIDAQTVLNVGAYLSTNKKSYADIGATAHAYVAGDLIGTKLTLAAATPASGGSGRLKSILMIDKSNVGPELCIIFFDADPTGTTFTDGASFGITTDQPKVIGLVNIPAANWKATSPKIVDLEFDRSMRAVGSRNIFAAIVCMSSFTPGISDSLMATFQFEYNNA